MKKISLIIVILSFFVFSKAQSDFNKLGLGVGFGINYGGLGANFTWAPIQYLSVTGHAGFNLVDLNAGIGANVYLRPRTKVYRPTVKGIYGYNGVILNIDYSSYNETYYGFTFGVGNEFRFGAKRAQGFDVDILIPLRSDEFYDDWEDMKDNPSVEALSDPMPFAVSIGYHFDF